MRENEDDEGSEASVVLDNAAGAAPEAFETAVSEAASWALALLGRGYRVSLVLRGATLAADTGPAQATRILRTLALVEPAAADAALEARAPEHATIRVRPGAPPELARAPRDPARRSA